MLKVLEFLKLPEGVRIPYLGGLWYRFLSRMENGYIRKKRITDFPLNRTDRTERIIVSLTSFPERINTVHLAIKSLMLQTHKPDQIILWLAEDQFTNTDIPSELEDLTKLGLVIRFCPDIKSHKKYYYALKEINNDLLITYDDDIIYPPDSIERLVRYHLKFRECIICNRGLEMIHDNAGNLEKYRAWKVLSSIGVREPSIKIMPSTGGGCLYPPGSLDAAVFNLDYIKRYAFSADDIWMRVMSLLKNTKVVKTKKWHKTFTMINKSQHVQLAFENHLRGQNDVVVDNLQQIFPEAFSHLMGDAVIHRRKVK